MQTSKDDSSYMSGGVYYGYSIVRIKTLHLCASNNKIFFYLCAGSKRETLALWRDLQKKTLSPVEICCEYYELYSNDLMDVIVIIFLHNLTAVCCSLYVTNAKFST